MERQLEKVMAQIAEQKQQLSIEKPKECELRQCLKATTLTRKMMLAFVDCIYVYSDKSIHVKWNFDESEGQGYGREKSMVILQDGTPR
jgi:site-specific DNA recombinase